MPMAQVRSAYNRPLLTVRGRKMPVLRARGGHGRQGRTQLRRGGEGRKLNRRVRPVKVTTCFVGKAQRARGSVQVEMG